MQQKGAYISIDAICRKWLAKREKSIHTYWKTLIYAADAVQELTLSTLPLLQHKIITRPAGQTWFDLPEGLTAVVSVGFPYKGSWKPLGISNTLIPFPSYNGAGDLGTGFGEGFGPGAQINQGDGTTSIASFSGDDFDPAGFATAAVPEGQTPNGWYGSWALGFDRQDTVAVSIAQNQIYVSPRFPVDKLYVVYVAVGSIDTMTHIPIIAEAAIQAYISWQYMQNKRDGARIAQSEKYEWYRQHRILRARLNPLTTTSIKQIINSRWRHGYDPDLLQPAKTNDSSGIVPPAPSVNAYFYTSQANYAVPTQSQILTWTQQVIPGDLSKVILFPSAAYEYLLFAYPATQPDPTGYYVNPFDNGTLGAGGTFGAPITVGAFRLIISNYPTQITDPVTFS